MDLMDIFSYGHWFGDNNYLDLLELKDAIDQGTITIEEIRLPTKEPFDDWPSIFRHRKQFSGKDQHQELCSYAALWLEAQGVPWSSAPKDLHYPGGIADVIALDGSIAVECGYTQSEKVLNACDKDISVLVVPYQEEIVGYLFRSVSFKRIDRYEKAKKEAVSVLKVPVPL